MALQVRLAGVPAHVMQASLEHLETLVRELRLIAEGIESGRIDGVTISMAEYVEELIHAFAEPRSDVAAQTRAAITAGESEVDMSITVPTASAGSLAYRLVERLEEADRWAREGKLATEPADAAIATLRRWVAQEIALQSTGFGPTRFAAR